MSTSQNDLENFCLRNGWPDTSIRGLVNLVVRINNTLRQLARQKPWPSLQRFGFLQTTVPYTTGTVALTGGSAAVVGTLTVWTDAMAGQEFYGPDSKAYFIASVESPTALTLEEPYLGDNATGASYSLRFIRYTAPTDFSRAGRFRHRTLGALATGGDLAEFLQRRAYAPTTATGPGTVWITPDAFYMDPAPTVADQIRYGWQKNPALLTANGQTVEWPEPLMWLLYECLSAVIRVKADQTPQAILLTDPMRLLIDEAFATARPSMAPVIEGEMDDAQIGWESVTGRYAFPDT